MKWGHSHSGGKGEEYDYIDKTIAAKVGTTFESEVLCELNGEVII